MEYPKKAPFPSATGTDESSQIGVRMAEVRDAATATPTTCIGQAAPPPRPILIASTSWWAFPARIAMAFARCGFRVEAICPHGHPLVKTRAVQHIYRYRALDPLGALAAAIERGAPELIVPCDDRVVGHLHALHSRLLETGRSGTALIERSLGSRDGFATIGARSDLILIARAEGIRAPEMQRVGTVEELRVAVDRLGLPAVLKQDGTWGGLGVVVARSIEQAEESFHKLTQPLSARKALKRLIVNGDPFSILPWLGGVKPTVNVQRFVRGRPANCAAACWEGEVLAISNVEVLRAQDVLGASTVVRAITNHEMSEATRRLVRRLQLSGFCGLDFLLDESGAAHLLELNARSTPLCHLAVGIGRNPLGALAEKVAGMPLRESVQIKENTIAFFPQAWLLEPDSEFLHNGYHDVPWEEPELMQELMKLPWPERSLLAQASGRFRRRNRAPIGRFD